MNRENIKQGLRYLCDVDSSLAKQVPVFGLPEPRSRPAGFEAFVAAIVSQQLSREAASTIFSRVKDYMPNMQPQQLLDAPKDELRSLGLSQRKIEYIQGLAAAICSGQFQPQQLTNLSDQQAIASITELRGFGRWSAEIYLMFSLGRRDIFPADDLALQVALARLKGFEEKLKPKQARELTAHWSPWRSVGSLFLWHFYRGAPQ